MTALEFIQAAYLKATGETFTGSFGDTDASKLLAIGNQYIRNWSNEEDVDWHSLYEPEHSIGTVTATDSFPLDLTVIKKLSPTRLDYIRIDHTDGKFTNFELVDAEDLKQFYTGNKENFSGNYCAQIGPNLVFNRVFKATDPQFGGTIKVPVYLYPASLVESGDAIPVDNPDWLVFVSAAEWVRNDITKQSLYPLIISEANSLMQRMIDDNNTTQVETVNRVPIGGGANW